MANRQNVPDVNEPLSVGAYLGYELLFLIPCIGWIAMVICAFSKNINLRNYARAHICVMIILLLVIAAALVYVGNTILPDVLKAIEYIRGILDFLNIDSVQDLMK